MRINEIYFKTLTSLGLMQDMRNTIVHEYIEDHLVGVFEPVLEYSGSFMGIMKNTRKYMAELLG